MKQIPLKEYIEKLVDYNKNNSDISTLFKDYKTFTYKFELIKDTLLFPKTISDSSRMLFNRYMNDDRWIWKWK